MASTSEVHKQFARYFRNPQLEPYLFLLSQKLEEGKVCIDLGKIEMEELKEEGYENISSIRLQSEKMVSDGTVYSPLVLWENQLYFQRYFHYETLVLEKIKELVEEGKQRRGKFKSFLEAQADLIKTLFPSQPALSGPNWQLVACLSAILNSFTIITGGPGTGKTTTIAQILKLLLLFNPQMKVALAAPTGKAAARMAESLKTASYSDKKMTSLMEGLEPSTIHRLLGTKRNSLYFKHNEENPLPYDLLIVDESSMIDLALLAKLLMAVPKGMKVILLGDKDQLSSVEAGSLFGDFCLSQPQLNQFSSATADFINLFTSREEEEIVQKNKGTSNHLLFERVIELQHSYRFSDQGGIGRLSKAIINHDVSSLSVFFDNRDDTVTIDIAYSSIVFENFVAGYKEYISEPDLEKAFEKLNRLRILCAIREGPEGLYAINRRIEQLLAKKGLISLGEPYYEHRPIMVTGNNYELGLFNGDIGIVRKKGDELRVWFEDGKGGFRSLPPSFIDSSETVYAMTIHKSQGSEFEQVMVILPQSLDIPILTRELLYTAVTRAKKRVLIQGSREALFTCTSKRVERGSGVIKRLRVK